MIHWSAVFCLPFQHMLSKVGMWDFDIFLFDRLTNGKSPKRILFSDTVILFPFFSIFIRLQPLEKGQGKGKLIQMKSKD